MYGKNKQLYKITYLYSVIVGILTIIMLPITTTTSNAFTQEQNKLSLINAVFQDANDNCNIDITKYSKETIQTSLDICKKSMAWLKVECDVNYDNSQICRENMPAIKTYLTRNNFDDRDIQYFYNDYQQNRLATQLDPNTKLSISYIINMY